MGRKIGVPIRIATMVINRTLLYCSRGAARWTVIAIVAFAALLFIAWPILSEPAPAPDGLTRSGGAILLGKQGEKPGEFQQFRVSVQLPDEGDSVMFPALQTYSNGAVVSWVDPTGPDAPEAEHPAPTVTLTAGGDEHGGGEEVTTTTTASGSSASGPVETAQDDADTAKTIGIVAIIFSVIALIGVAIALARRSKSTTA